MSEKIEEKKSFRLTSNVAGSSDLARLIRELEELNDFFYQSKIRSHGSSVSPPKSSLTLEGLAKDNHCSLLDEGDRSKMLDDLKAVQKSAPKIHVSFATEPSAKFLEKITDWMRKNLHKDVLVDVGLQPGIAVGCIVRTENKVFDLSLRNRFKNYKKDLVSALGDPSDKPKAGGGKHE